MNRFPKDRMNRLRSVVRYISAKRIPVYAGYAGYFIVLSLFPLLVLFLGLLRYLGLSVDTLTDALKGIVPAALLPAAKKLIQSTYRNTSGTAISLSALAALWSASRGFYGLLRGLNAVYEVKEDRGYFRARAISVGYTFAFLLVLLTALSLRVFGRQLFGWLPAGLEKHRFITVLVVQSSLFTAMFCLLPNGRNPVWRSIPGALFASLGWLIFSGLFSLYVEHAPGYAGVYGSVYLVALSMLWLYCCITILLYGGALNHYLARENAGPEKIS